MRIKKTEQTVFTFDELSDRAKETAIDGYRRISADDFGSFHADDVLADCARVLALLGLNISTKPVRLMGGSTRQDPNVYWAVGSRDSGASYAGSYGHNPGSVGAIAAECPAVESSKSNQDINRIARELAAVQRKNFYQLQANIDHKRSYGFGRSLAIDVDIERADSRPVSDADVETLTELLRDCAHWIYRSLEDDYEYRQTDDYIADEIRANEYEFTEDGNRA